MQGYFCYDLYGNKEEVEKAEELMNRIAAGEIEDEKYYMETAKELLVFSSGVCKVNSNDNEEFDYRISFDMGSSGNVSELPFEFESMSYFFGENFVDCRIEGTGYLIDYPPYEKFVIEKGRTDCELEYEKQYILLCDEVDEENKSVSFFCPACNCDLEFDLEDVDLKKSYHNVNCECCGVEIECEFDLDIEEILNGKVE